MYSLLQFCFGAAFRRGKRRQPHGQSWPQVLHSHISWRAFVRKSFFNPFDEASMSLCGVPLVSRCQAFTPPLYHVTKRSRMSSVWTCSPLIFPSPLPGILSFKSIRPLSFASFLAACS